jgi:coenzyme F420-reducing hydrogenase delta subunit/ferredoxin
VSTVNRAEVSAGAAAAAEGWQPQIVALVCNWCSYAGADMAGTTRLQYPPAVRMVRFPCTGRMHPLMVLKAFEGGADGVLVSGCHPGDCHYVHGNLVARRRFAIFRALMDFLGLDMRRLHFSWVSAAEGQKWARVVLEVTEAVRAAGPLPERGYSEHGADVDLPAAQDDGPPQVSDEALTALRSHLRRAAASALEDGRAMAVLGLGRSSRGRPHAPLVVTNAVDCQQLEWGVGWGGSPASYLAAAAREHGRVAVVARACELGGVIGLAREGQVARDRLVIIGVQCLGASDGDRLADRCARCSGAPDGSCDVVVTPAGAVAGTGSPGEAERRPGDPRDRQIAYLESLPHAQRWGFWQRQLARCLRCYACRAVCPLCYCSSCVAEKHRPQWVSTAIDSRGNTAWNVIRALHLAGRCSGCDECTRACPADIRLDLLNRKLTQEVEERYGQIGLSLEERSALVDFRMEDGEEFIR